MRAGGYGFVQTAEGQFFVPASALSGAFDGDLVELAPLVRSQGKGSKRKKGSRGAAGRDVACDLDGREAPAARVLRVLDRAHDTVIGRYEVAEPFGVVVPEDSCITYDIFTMRADYPDVPDGALVRVRIAQFPTRHTAATGVIEEVIGVADEADVGVDLIVARHKLETEFSQGAVDEARSATLDVDGALAGGYRDIRERYVFTIDPADAKDFDDAISLDLVDEAEVSDLLKPGAGHAATFGGRRAASAGGAACAGGAAASGERRGADAGSQGQMPRRLWRLGVHIADVSHYVPWNSSIDMDARRRATSVYLVDRVIPMLPPELSDDLCSLRPGCDRRAMTVDLYLDDAAHLVRYDIYPALIRSNVRLTYDAALELIEDGRPAGDATSSDDAAQPNELIRRLRACSRLAKRRARARTRAGGIDFATTEAKVRLDANGTPQEIVLRVKNDATELVEEAMILANETVAAHLESRGWPCAYRVHERPSSDALADLVPVFREFDWFTQDMPTRLAAGDPHVIQDILDASSGR